MMATLKYWLWEKEINVPERYRPLSNTYATGFAIAYALMFVPIFFSTHFSLLGPGLGEPVSWALVRQQTTVLYAQSQQGGYLSFYYSFLVLLSTAILLRGGIGLRTYFKYRDAKGKRFPLNELWLWSLVNQIGVLGLLMASVLVATIVMVCGGHFVDGLHCIDAMSQWAHQTVDNHIPTLIELPSWLAVLLIYLLASFVHYWAHRLSHQLRAGWLLFHRLHHMPNILAAPTTLPVFFSIPLLLVVVVPFNFVFASIAKLLSSQPLYIEAAVLMSIILLADPWSHASALYQEAKNNRLLRFLGWCFCTGAYHVMHHSSDKQHAGRSGVSNLVNLSSFAPLAIWDRIFGTYIPPSAETPNLGLTGNAELHKNPLRLALAGTAQIGYELWMNKSLQDRFWILFGSSAWNPPITRDFALKTQTNKRQARVAAPFARHQ